jgi:hypothetical protein
MNRGHHQPVDDLSHEFGVDGLSADDPHQAHRGDDVGNQ